MQWEWLSNTERLQAEWKQSADEGRTLLPWEESPGAGLAGLDEVSREKRAGELYDALMEQPPCPGLLRREPSGLAEIRDLRPPREETPPGGPPGGKPPDRLDRVHGAWLGRCAGCLLGKPFEGWSRADILAYLEETRTDPRTGYAHSSRILETRERFARYRGYPGADAWGDRVECAPPDDDTNYTLVGLRVLEMHGRGFTAAHVAGAWLRDLPVLSLCTAERVAYRNLLDMHSPGASARVRNPYREWVGAQIRADIYGYICPGDPAEAARMAWTDASVSHTRNGLYGAMLVAAMLAQAHVEHRIPRIVAAGQAQIPAESRLAEALEALVQACGEGRSWEETLLDIHAVWDESDMHHWSHTIPNALIVCASLLYGEGRFGESVGRAVLSGFDTDCNAATVGSLVGMRTGARGMGTQWTGPLRGKLASSVRGAGLVDIAEVARRTVALIEEGHADGCVPETD